LVDYLETRVLSDLMGRIQIGPSSHSSARSFPDPSLAGDLRVTRRKNQHAIWGIESTTTRTRIDNQAIRQNPPAIVRAIMKDSRLPPKAPIRRDEANTPDNTKVQKRRAFPDAERSMARG
jgi:hypothetical protein